MSDVDQLLALFADPLYSNRFTDAEKVLIDKFMDGTISCNPATIKFYVSRLDSRMRAFREKIERGRVSCYRLIAHDIVRFRYETVCKLGKGSFGAVIKAIDHATPDQRFVALKFIDKKSTFHGRREAEMAEKITGLRETNQPGAVHVAFMQASMVVDSRLVIVYDFVPGLNIDDDLEKLGRTSYSLPDGKIVIKGIVGGASFLHKNGIMHTDLKCDNVMVQRNGEGHLIKSTIIDLGNALLLGEVKAAQDYYIQVEFQEGDRDSSGSSSIRVSCSYSRLPGFEILGATPYRPPESVYLYLSKVNEKVDVWVVGLLAAELLTGSRPFLDKCTATGERAIECLMFDWKCYLGDLKRKFPDHEKLSHRAKDPWYHSWVADKKVPKASKCSGRLTALLRAHPHLESFVRLCLAYDSSRRPSAEELLSHPFLLTA